MKVLTVVLSLLSFSLFSQAPLSKTVYDCAGNSRDIQQTLGTGKALLVAHKGVDCSICRSQAPAFQNWAAQNTNRVEVWGALSWTYNPNSFTPECIRTNAWVSQYSWNDIFTFADSVRDWAMNQSPIYYVYSPVDSSIVYQGSSRTTAQSMALNTTLVGFDDYFLANDVSIKQSSASIELANLTSDVSEVRILNIQGKMLLNQRPLNGRIKVQLSTEKRLIIIQLIGQGKVLGNKKMISF